MPPEQRTRRSGERARRLAVAVAATSIAICLPVTIAAQGMTGTLIATVKDEQGSPVQGARVRIHSPALIGGPVTLTTPASGRLRFLTLPPGEYGLDVDLAQFDSYHEADIAVGAGGTIERTVVLVIGGVAESIVVEGVGTRIDARDPGVATRFRREELRAIPTRRSSMFDLIRATPGVSPTSPSSATVNTVSVFGSATNENTFLIDGTNFTCPCNGVARSEPVVDFIQELQVQSAGASVEFGNLQGGVVNVVLRQGGERYGADVSYYSQWSALTSAPRRLAIPGAAGAESGYERARYRDLAANAGGPILRDRLWFFAGYQYLRDYDSQPGTDPRRPRTYEQDKVLAKLTWRLAPGMQLVQSFHEEFWVSPEQPSVAKPFEATFRRTARVPAITFGHLTHTLTPGTVWDVRVGRFMYAHEDGPSTGDPSIAGRVDSATGFSSGAPPAFGGPTLTRLTGKATITSFLAGPWGSDHQLRAGTEIERGDQRADIIIPTGQRFIDVNGAPSERVSSPPSNTGGMFVTAAAFVSDAVTIGDRLTINLGVRFDHNRAVSQDLPALDVRGQETGEIVQGLGRLYSWNRWSPRLGAIVRLTRDGRTILRTTWGRYSQGVLTGEFQSFHPGATAVTTTRYSSATGNYTGISRVVDPRVNLRLDPNIRAPHSDEFTAGLDRELRGRLSVGVAYVHKDGRDYIGWQDAAGQYRAETRRLADGRDLPVFVLTNATGDRRFLLTNPAGYSLTYDGVVLVAEKRRAHGWQGSGSYTWSRASGLLPSSGASAAAPQASTVAPPPAPAGLTFGRDPNDLANARGRLPNDRPHVVRVAGAVDVPRTRFALAATFQHFTGKPWAATALVALPQNAAQRILLEPRGSRRLASQSLLDVRLSRVIDVKGFARVELLIDLLNALDESAGEGVVTDALQTESRLNAQFGVPNGFVDPRRAMVSVRVQLGR